MNINIDISYSPRRCAAKPEAKKRARRGIAAESCASISSKRLSKCAAMIEEPPSVGELHDRGTQLHGDPKHHVPQEHRDRAQGGDSGPQRREEVLNLVDDLANARQELRIGDNGADGPEQLHHLRHLLRSELRGPRGDRTHLGRLRKRGGQSRGSFGRCG
jgi:hypothetical protein